MKNVSILIALLLTQYSCWASNEPVPADQPPAHTEEVAPTYEDTILTEMFAAAHNGLPALQEYLSSHAQYGITINFVDLNGNTALHRALFMNDVEAVRALIAAGINVNLKTIEGVSELLCLAAVVGVPLIVQELLNAPRIKVGKCAEATEMPAIKELIRQAISRHQKAQSAAPRDESERSNDRAKWKLNQQMYRIINSGDMRELEAFLKKHRNIVNYIHPDSGISYLMYVILAGPLLLKPNEDLVGHISFITGRPLSDWMQLIDGKYYRRGGNPKLAVNAAGNIVLNLTFGGYHYEIIYSNYIETVRLLLRAGADVTARSVFKEPTPGQFGDQTALHVAARFGRAEVIPLLIEAGADATGVRSEVGIIGGTTPFFDALRWCPDETLAETLHALLRAPTFVIDENSLKLIKKTRTTKRIKETLEQVLKSEGSKINPSTRRVLEQALAGADVEQPQSKLETTAKIAEQPEVKHGPSSEEGWVDWLGRMVSTAGGLLTPAGSEGGAGPVIPGRKGAQQEMEERHLEREAYEYAKSHPGEKGKGKEKESPSPRRSPR